MAVSALGTMRIQHARACKHTPRECLAPCRDLPIAPVLTVAWVWLYLGWGAQRAWGGTRPSQDM